MGQNKMPSLKTIWSYRSWPLLLIRIYLAWIFLYACYHKILNPSSFALDIATYDILPLYFVHISAIILPWVELASGAMLLIGFRVKAAALLVSGMMVIFITAIVIALAKGLDMSCGCFASSAAVAEDPISWMTIVRDGVWLALSLGVLFFDDNPIGLDRL
jgi:uncharacterized membrane protein YphA (DoxX/SURF4 family)